MLSSGLTLIFSMMGVLNFAHASFYMLGAYLAYTVSRLVGFWPALLVAPLLVGALGALFERTVPAQGAQVRPRARTAHHLRPVYMILELVQLVWGRIAPSSAAAALQGPAYANNSAEGPACTAGPLFTPVRHAVPAVRAAS
jgi:branched-chain amino acid transport system permease protein